MEDNGTVLGDEIPTSAKEGISINPAVPEALQQKRLQRQFGTRGRSLHAVLKDEDSNQ